MSRARGEMSLFALELDPSSSSSASDSQGSGTVFREMNGAIDAYSKANDFIKQERFADALAELTKARNVFQSHSGKSRPQERFRRGTIAHQAHVNCGHVLFGTALVCKKQGRYHEAMQEYGRARSVFHAAVGKNHVYSALVVRNMAIMCDSLGKLDEAIAYYKEALDIYKYTVGRESADFAEVLMSSSSVLMQQRKYDQALIALQAAQGILDKTLGRENALYAGTVMNMAIVLKKQGKLEESLAEMENARAMYEVSVGEEDQAYALSLFNKAMVLGSMDRLDEAALTFQQSVDIFDKALGTDHPSTQQARHYLQLCPPEAVSRAAEAVERKGSLHSSARACADPMSWLTDWFSFGALSNTSSAVAANGNPNTSGGQLQAADASGSEAFLCTVCMEKERAILFLPCGHLCTCVACADSIAACPVCRTAINQRHRAYM